MTPRFTLGFAALGCVLLASCYPYNENQQRRRRLPDRKPQDSSVSTVEQQKIKEQREKLKQEDAIRRTEEEKKRVVESPDTRPSSGGTPTPPPEPKRDFTVATKVPGKDGFVFSPYNNKVIDVRGISTGTLVQDPTYPAAEKKYFRVP